MFLVALAVPGVEARCCVDAPVILAVVVDVDVRLGVYVAEVNALPAVGSAAVRLGGPAI